MIIYRLQDKLDELNNKKPLLNTMLAMMMLVGMLCIKTLMAMITVNWYAPTIAGGSCLTALFAILMVRKKRISYTRSGLFILAMEIIIGLFFIFNGLVLRIVAYSVIGVVFAFLLPIVQYALATNDPEKISEHFCMSITIAYIILLIANMFWGPIMTKFQFGSILGNSNLLGNFLVILIPSLSYLLIKKKASFKKEAVGWGLLVSAVSMLVFTSSRTSALAICFSMGFFLIMMIVSRDKTKKLRLEKKQIITIVIITAAVPFVMFFMLSTVRKNIVILSHKISMSFSDTDSKSDSELDNEEKEIEDIENMVTEYNLNYYIKGLDGAGDESFSSGRITIWKEFAKNVGIMGHSSEQREVIEETRHYEHVNAHNVYLQVAYTAGIAAGCAYLIAVVFIGIKALAMFAGVIAKKEKLRPELLLSYCFFIGFAITSLTSDGYMMFNYFPVTLFWLTAHNYMFKQKNQNEENPK